LDDIALLTPPFCVLFREYAPLGGIAESARRPGLTLPGRIAYIVP
jgi:hypothetical protein